jgi:uncharacterized membrane protein YphA (DoxX/SURF4 family)
MTRLAIVFLILLRLAVGWHFYYEGFLKYRSTELIGTTVTNKPFSSAGYFRSATGPLGDAWRRFEGDPDQQALARLVVRPADAGDGQPGDRMPPALAEDWKSYVDRFKTHYQLEHAQAVKAEEARHKAEKKMVEFLTYVAPARAEDQLKDVNYPTYTVEVTRTFPDAELKRRMTMAERIDEYRAKLAQVRDAGAKVSLMWKDVEGARLRSAKGEVASLRAKLLKDVDAQTQDLKKALDGIPTKEQKEEAGTMPEPAADKWLPMIDRATMYGLMAIGLCLMAGLLTRTSAWLGVLFLAMTYLAVPAWPWLPAPPVSEGSYLFVNKNLIELLALAVIGTSVTGRWFGLDGLLYLGWCGIRRKAPAR